MREIVVDTETTGLDPVDHRIVEIGCVELINHIATGKEFHAYLNPERGMPAEHDASRGREVTFDPTAYPQLHVANPVLWWPYQFGSPELYHLVASATVASGTCR